MGQVLGIVSCESQTHTEMTANNREKHKLNSKIYIHMNGLYEVIKLFQRTKQEAGSFTESQIQVLWFKFNYLGQVKTVVMHRLQPK